MLEGLGMVSMGLWCFFFLFIWACALRGWVCHLLYQGFMYITHGCGCFLWSYQIELNEFSKVSVF